MLFHTLYAPESGVYVEQLSCVLSGALNIAKFEQAWHRVFDRHSILRTAFVWEGVDEPLQVVGRRVKLSLDSQDWKGLSSAEQKERLQDFIEADRSRGFKLTKAPLMRLALIQLEDDVHQFVWTYHHLLLDVWSLPILLK